MLKRYNCKSNFYQISNSETCSITYKYLKCNNKYLFITFSH